MHILFLSMLAKLKDVDSLRFDCKLPRASPARPNDSEIILSEDGNGDRQKKGILIQVLVLAQCYRFLI